MLSPEHSKGNGQCSLFFSTCSINSLEVGYGNCIWQLNIQIKDLLREVPENADTPVQYFISIMIVSRELIPSSGSQVIK